MEKSSRFQFGGGTLTPGGAIPPGRKFHFFFLKAYSSVQDSKRSQ
jgi:hypothetical protein